MRRCRPLFTLDVPPGIVSAPPAAGLAVMGNLLEYFSLTKTKFQPKIYAVTILRKLLTKLK